MEGQARVAGKIYKDVQIGDKTYRLSQPNLVGIYGEVEAWIIARKTDPLVLAVRACKLAPEPQWKTIWDSAMQAGSSARIASPEELNLFWGSRWSNAFRFWKALDPKHAEEVPSVEAAMKVLDGVQNVDEILFQNTISQLGVEDLLAQMTSAGVDMDELMAQISVVNGEADVKNSAGPNGTRATNQPMETPVSEAGLDSTSSSPTSTDGPQSK